MEYFAQIIDQIIGNFDFAYMIVVNVLTYLLVKGYEYWVHKAGKGIKIIFLLVSIVGIGAAYLSFAEVPKHVLLNSAVLAPVFFDWILKPLLEKLGIGYLKHDAENSLTE